MTTEELTPEQEQAAMDEAFAAGFAEVRGEEPVKAEPEPAKEAEPVEAEPPKEAEPEEDPELLQAVAEEGKPDPRLDQLLGRMAEIDKMRSGFDKLSGHVGTILQQLQELKTAPKAPEPELPKVDPKEFAEAYPEFASYLRDQLATVAPSIPDEVVQRLAAAEQRGAELAAQLEERTITLMHPDWAEVVNADGYKAWLGGQPEELQKTARETPYATELGKVLTAYKSAQKKAQTQQQRQQRLEAALPPSAVEQPPKVQDTEEEAFASGWTSVRGRAV